MKFASPEYLYALPVVWLALGLGTWFANRRRRELLERFTGPASAWSNPGHSPTRRAWDAALTVLVVTGMLVALARPLYFKFDERSESNGAPYLVAIDASRSMLAADVRPTRYSAVTNALDRFFGEATGDRVGIITFAGVAYLNAPLTFDAIALRTILGYVNPYAITDPGSSIASGLDRAARYFTTNNLPQRTVIVISDGEDLDGKALALTRKLHRDHRLTVHTIGVGTATGARIPGQRGGAVTNATGFQVTTKLDETTLRRIANAGGGRYFRLGENGDGLRQLRAEVLRPLAEEAARNERENYREGFFVPLGLALAALLAKLALGADRTLRRRPLPAILHANT